MEQLEKVEKIREKLNVSHEEAKNALNACDWDVLDAIVYLEKLGKVEAPKVSSYTTKAEESEEFKLATKEYEKQSSKYSFSELVHKFLNWAAGILKQSCESSMRVIRNDVEIMNIPLVAVIVLMCVSFWVILGLMIAGLFMNCRYEFNGPIADANVNLNINEVAEKASETCVNIKNDLKKDE